MNTDASQHDQLRVALVQASLSHGQVSKNLDNIDGMLGDTGHADLIVLPEMFNTGFSMDSRANSEEPDGPTTRWMQQLAAARNAVVCGSLSIRVGADDYRNRLLWVRPDGSYEQYDKRHLFRMGGEHKRFGAGKSQLVVELKGWRVRPLICYDLRFPVWSRDAQNTDLLLYVACWPEVRANAWNTLLAARALENQCYVVGVNRVGKDHNGYAHSGDSQALDFVGKSLVHVRNQQNVVHTSLDLQALKRHKEKFPAYMDADSFELLG